MFPNSKYNEISKKILSINITSFFMHMLFLVLRFKVQVSVSIFSIPIFKTTVNVSPMHQPLEEVILFVLCYGIACMFCIDVTFYLYKLFHNNTHQQSVKQGLFALIFYIGRSYSKGTPWKMFNSVLNTPLRAVRRLHTTLLKQTLIFFLEKLFRRVYWIELHSVRRAY